MQLVREVVSTAARSPEWLLFETAGLVRILIRCGAMEDAEELVRKASPQTLGDKATIISARAALEEARAAFEGALALYREAVEAWTDHGHYVELAQALLGEGRCLVQLGRMQEATQRLRGARDLFASFGAEPLLAETDEWLARATALSS